MRASKLITASTIAVLLGGTSLAIGQGADMLQGGTAAGQGGSERGSVVQGRSNPRAAENPTSRGEVSGERGFAQGPRELQRGQAMTGERDRTIGGARAQATGPERGRAITGERGQAMSSERNGAITGERGQALGSKRGRVITGERGGAVTGERGQAIVGERGQMTEQGRGELRSRQLETGEFGAARGSAREAEQQRMRLRDILENRTDIPRVSRVETNIRVGAVVPRGVRMAPVPQEVARLQPRFRGNRVFFYREQIVIVDPATLRIIAVLPA